MKLSTKGRYGLKAMYDIAENYGASPISISVIADKQHISVNYLEQLISLLKKAGLLLSVRGAQGGYHLSRPPSEIYVGEILRALEGSLAPTDCVKEDASCECYCVQRSIYQKIYDGINAVVDNISLQDMLDDMKTPLVSEIVSHGG